MVPNITTLEASKVHRGSRLFIDFSQNDPADTIDSAYAVRPGKKSLISTPLEWRQVKKGLHPDQFDTFTIFDRLASIGDLWWGLTNSKTRQANSTLMKKLIQPTE